MKDRDIKKDEINKITAECPIKEKAFFTIMRQSGLTPQTIKRLRIGNVERILEPDPPVPCKITVPQEEYPTFIGQEAIDYLKQYLRRRKDTLTPESLLFTKRNDPNTEINTKNVSRTFKESARKAKVNYKIGKGEPSELRLFSLTKFYRKNTIEYRKKLNDKNTPKDDESYRNLYREEAMLELEIEPLTPIKMLKRENKKMKDQLTKIENSMMPVTRLYHELTGTIPERILLELKPDIPIRNEEDREQRIEKALHKLVESLREEEQKNQ